MMAVCVRCRHYDRSDWSLDYLCTLGPIADDPVRGARRTYVRCESKNADGNCPDFRHPWWAFWRADPPEGR